jgi:hypothetical protein
LLEIIHSGNEPLLIYAAKLQIRQGQTLLVLAVVIINHGTPTLLKNKSKKAKPS